MAEEQQQKDMVDITPSPQRVLAWRRVFQDAIQGFQRQLQALTTLQSLNIPRHFDDMQSFIDELLVNAIDTKRGEIEKYLKRLEWGIIEIDEAAQLKAGPHHKIMYDLGTLEPEKLPTRQTVYLPVRAVQHFGSIEEAFTQCYGPHKGRVYDTMLFTREGKPWPGTPAPTVAEEGSR